MFFMVLVSVNSNNPATHACLLLFLTNQSVKYITFFFFFSHLSDAISWQSVIYLWPFRCSVLIRQIWLCHLLCVNVTWAYPALPVYGLSGHYHLNFSLLPSPLSLVLTSWTPHLQRRRGETRTWERKSRTHSLPKLLTTPRRCPRQCQS